MSALGNLLFPATTGQYQLPAHNGNRLPAIDVYKRQEYNDSTKGNSYEVIYLIPEGVDHAAYYDIGNLLMLKLFMRTDGLSDASFRYAPDYTSIIFTYSIPAEASRLAKKEAYDRCA